MKGIGANTIIGNITSVTATPLKGPDLPAICVRVVVVAAGVLVSSWGLYNCYASWGEIELSSIAAQITAGEQFKTAYLASLEPRLDGVSRDPWSKPNILRSVAIIRVRQAESELSMDHSLQGNPIVARAEVAIRAALNAMPTDAFLWFALCWLKKSRDGFDPSLVPLLQRSYDVGEHEGWIAIHRNALAVTLLSSLPAPLRGEVVTEFRNLIMSNYVPGAVDIMLGPGWSHRDALLEGLRSAPEQDRRNFARELSLRGLRVEVPGIDQRPSRPWR